jgi:ubiquinone/menaquinone biosynthesis C-methylase UbiE
MCVTPDNSPSCECVLCTFPDKATAAAEMARVLGRGGRVGITDITAAPRRLPAGLTGLAARAACVVEARPAGEYRCLLQAAGLRVTAAEHHTQAMDRMIRQITSRLDLLKIIAARLEKVVVGLTRTDPVLDAARTGVRDGILGYVLIVADKP